MDLNATHIIQTLREQGHVAYLAGGCVRDMLLGKEPYDYDIATSARPEVIQQIFSRTITVGAHFGVVVVRLEGQEYQVATFRKDGPYADGRRPTHIHFSDAEEDARRRDFTINGLFFDPIESRVIDYVGGQDDLARRVIRAIGNPEDRFAEDYLRVLRAVRFATVLDFKIVPETWSSILQYAPHIHQVSAERIREEISKLLLHPHRLIGFDFLDGSRLLQEILPEIETLRGCEQPAEFHPEGDVFVHTRLMLQLLRAEASLPLVLAVLFHDLGKPPTFQRDPTGRIRFNGHEKVSATLTRQIMQRLRFSSHEIEATEEMVRQHMAFKDVQHMRVAKLKRFMARPTFEDELELHRVDCASSHGLLDNYHFLLAKKTEFASEPLIPTPLLKGADLIAVGLKPGPTFKTLLEEAQTLQLEGKLLNREAAQNWLKQRLR